MLREIVRVRMTIKDINRTTLCQTTEYGLKIGARTIRIGGRYFHAGRRAGFGKSAYIHENENGQYHRVVIDRIETIGIYPEA